MYVLFAQMCDIESCVSVLFHNMEANLHVNINLYQTYREKKKKSPDIPIKGR